MYLENGSNLMVDRNTQKYGFPIIPCMRILAGLMDIYEVSGNQKALDVAKGYGELGSRAEWKSYCLRKHLLAVNTYIAGE